jgi:hypothetical protein
MKITHIAAAAGLVVAALGVSTSANAQDWRGDRDHREYRGDYRGHDRHDGRGYDRDRGRHYGWDRHHRRCWTEWRHHHRVRVCR